MRWKREKKWLEKKQAGIFLDVVVEASLQTVLVNRMLYRLISGANLLLLLVSKHRTLTIEA